MSSGNQSTVSALRYWVVSSWDIREFNQSVTQLLNEGWKCEAGVFVVFDQRNQRIQYYQAMTQVVPVSSAGITSVELPDR